MAADRSNLSLEERVERCALEFAVNARNFKRLGERSGESAAGKIWKHDLHRDMVTQSRERVARSQLLLDLTNRLLPNRAKPQPVASIGPLRKGPYPTNRAILLEHLALAEEHIEIGARNIARQEKIIAELDARGRDTVVARRMLKNFEESQAMSFADRERIRAELGWEGP